MIVRETQTPAYWQEFAIDDGDLNYLYELFLEDDNRPRTSDDLALTLVRRHCEREEDLIKSELAKGTPFQPGESYEVGEQVEAGSRTKVNVAVGLPAHNCCAFGTAFILNQQQGQRVGVGVGVGVWAEGVGVGVGVTACPSR